jgi:hypothetical protein
MYRLANLEMHVVHSCNLVCESCSHYSNQGHKGEISLEQADAWMLAWSGRLNPRDFSLLGGEPTIHPDLAHFVPLARRHWPRAHLRLVTNGFFLHRHPQLPVVLQQDPDACIYLSLHHTSAQYQEKLQPNLDLLRRWVADYGIRVIQYYSHAQWTRRYTGIGSAMAPFNDQDPRQSWEHCQARNYPQIFEAKLWKCAPLAYLGLQNEKYGLSEQWRPYLDYQPLAPDCSDLELAAFLKREDEAACGMCPAKPERFALPIPLRGAERESIR